MHVKKTSSRSWMCWQTDHQILYGNKKCMQYFTAPLSPYLCSIKRSEDPPSRLSARRWNSQLERQRYGGVPLTANAFCKSHRTQEELIKHVLLWVTTVCSPWKKKKSSIFCSFLASRQGTKLIFSCRKLASHVALSCTVWVLVWLYSGLYVEHQPTGTSALRHANMSYVYVYTCTGICMWIPVCVYTHSERVRTVSFKKEENVWEIQERKDKRVYLIMATSTVVVWLAVHTLLSRSSWCSTDWQARSSCRIPHSVVFIKVVNVDLRNCFDVQDIREQQQRSLQRVHYLSLSDNCADSPTKGKTTEPCKWTPQQHVFSHPHVSVQWPDGVMFDGQIGLLQCDGTGCCRAPPRAMPTRGCLCMGKGRAVGEGYGGRKVESPSSAQWHSCLLGCQVMHCTGSAIGHEGTWFSHLPSVLS